MNHTHVALMAILVSFSPLIASESNGKISTSLAALQAGGSTAGIVAGEPTVTSILIGKGMIIAKGAGTVLLFSPFGAAAGAAALVYYSSRNWKPITETKENN